MFRIPALVPVLRIVGVATLVIGLVAGCAAPNPESAPSRSPAPASPPPAAASREPAIQVPAGWRYLGLTEHEKVAPGLGRSYKFVGPEGRVDLYRYDLSHTGLLGGLDDERTHQHFAQVKADIMRGGGYVNLQHVGDDRLLIDGMSFIRARYSGLQRGQAVMTEAWLTVQDGRFLKLRITHTVSLDAAGRQRIGQFLRGIVRSFANAQVTML